MFKFKQIKIGNWFVSITSEPFDQRCVENGLKIDLGAALTKTLPLDDGTDGFRFKTPKGTKGLVRITNKLDADGPTLSQGDTLVRLAGDGIRCYVERVNTKRPLYNFAG